MRIHRVHPSVAWAMTLVAVALVSGLNLGVRQLYAAPQSALRSATVYEANKIVGSLAEPSPFSVLGVKVANKEASIELIAQIRPAFGERILVASQLDGLVTTALTSSGVVGHAISGGYVIEGTSQEALLRLGGKLPPGTSAAVVATVVSETSEHVQLLTQVNAEVARSPLLVFSFLGSAWPWLVLTAALAIGAIWLLLRRRHQAEWEG